MDVRVIHSLTLAVTSGILNSAPVLIFATYPLTQTIMYLNKRDRERAKIHN